MKLKYTIYVLLIFITFGSTKKSDKSSGINSEVDALIKALQQETWDAEETECLEGTVALLNGVKNHTLWATWVCDSNQLPMGLLYGSYNQLGSFDQCLNPPWLDTHPHLRTQYCIANVTLTNTQPKRIFRNWDPYETTGNYINTKLKLGTQFNSLIWGVCVPSSCRGRSVVKLLRHMYSRSQYAAVVAEPNVTLHYCQVSGAEYHYPTGFYLFIAMIAILFLISLISTWHQSSSYTKDSSSWGAFISRSFCLKMSYGKLMSPQEDQIPVLNGIRVISAILITFLHTYIFMGKIPIINLVDIENDMHQGLVSYFSHSDLIVDTFIAMSAALYISSLLTHVKQTKDLILMLLIRYFRLLGPLAVSVFYLSSVAEHTGSGPLWRKYYDEESSICSKNWLPTLLMLNASMKNACHIVTWFVCCDYQLAIFVTVIFYFYMKNKRLGLVVLTVASIPAVLIPGALTYWHQLPVLLMHIENLLMTNLRNVRHLEYTYSKSYSRGSVYLIGVIMGYLLYTYKPKEHRNTISKKWSIIGTSASLIVLCILLHLDKYLMDRDYNAVEVAILATLNRPIWAIAVCSIVIFCEYGDISIIRNILGFKIFQPLSHLCYGVYLTHLFVEQRIIYAFRTPLWFDLFSTVMIAVSVLMTSCLVSFVMWMLVEAPFGSLSCRILTRLITGNGIRNKATVKKNAPCTSDEKYNPSEHEKNKLL